MPLDYELDSQLKELTEISADYLDWFLQLTQRVFYASNHEDGQSFSRPLSFTAWFDEVSEKEDLDAKLLETLENRHNRLVKLSDNVINENLKTKEPPQAKEFSELVELFERFMDTLRRVEKELFLDETGIEPVTGLRKKSVLKKDLDREMQRLARQGKPFSLALVQIDHFQKIKDTIGDDGANKYLRYVSELIKKCLRSFDDAYRVDEAEFILSLKQADVSGGIRALERLKSLLEDNKYDFQSPDLNDSHVSLSCCVAEPLPEDSIEELIQNMHRDLKETDKDEDAVLEYYELSPLQRYIKAQ